MKTLLIVGNDHWGLKAARESASCPDCVTALDRNFSSVLRVLQLIAKRRLSTMLAVKMFLAELARFGWQQKYQPQYTVRNNADLLRLAGKIQANRILLFRAGLIVNSTVLKTIPVENIHCARIPDFGGLGSIDRALRAGVLEQTATHHKVTARIDEGEILGLEQYTLNPQTSYRENEDIAYRAGIVLLRRVLGLEGVGGTF